MRMGSTGAEQRTPCSNARLLVAQNRRDRAPKDAHSKGHTSNHQPPRDNTLQQQCTPTMHRSTQAVAGEPQIAGKKVAEPHPACKCAWSDACSTRARIFRCTKCETLGRWNARGPQFTNPVRRVVCSGKLEPFYVYTAYASTNYTSSACVHPGAPTTRGPSAQHLSYRKN